MWKNHNNSRCVKGKNIYRYILWRGTYLQAWSLRGPYFSRKSLILSPFGNSSSSGESSIHLSVKEEICALVNSGYGITLCAKCINCDFIYYKGSSISVFAKPEFRESGFIYDVVLYDKDVSVTILIEVFHSSSCSDEKIRLTKHPLYEVYASHSKNAKGCYFVRSSNRKLVCQKCIKGMKDAAESMKASQMFCPGWLKSDFAYLRNKGNVKSDKKDKTIFYLSKGNLSVIASLRARGYLVTEYVDKFRVESK